MVDRFIGREHELDLIDDLCTAAAAGRGAVVVVSGDPGIGKTRLATELAHRAVAAGLMVAETTCRVDSGAPALWPWRPVIDRLAQGDEGAELLERAVAAAEVDRFAHFAAVADLLEAACRRVPACVVIDDLHRADVGTLLLTRFVTRTLRSAPLLLVLTRRAGAPDEASTERELIEEIEAEAITVPLRHLGLAEAGELLGDHGVDQIDRALLEAVHRVTGGNPLFLRRLASLGAPAPGRSLPDGIRVAILEALARLSPESQSIMRASAVVGLAPSVREASAVAGVQARAVVGALGEAAELGIVEPGRVDRMVFTHDVVRSVLADSLAPVDRLDAHARAAGAVAPDLVTASVAQLSARARHALAAAPRSTVDAAAAVESCRVAAAALMGELAYEQAEALLGAAVELHESAGLGAPPADLLARWAEATLSGGHLANARERYAVVAEVARSEGDATLFAEAALGLGGHWVYERRSTGERVRVLGMQRDALAGLASDQVSLRCRLRARLAAEDVYEGASNIPVFAALDEARGCGDPRALAEVLSLTHHALLAPEHLQLRLELAEEMVTVAAEADVGVLSLIGLCWWVVDLFHAGDVRAERELADLRERCDALACQNVLYIVEAMEVMLLMRAGRLDEAEEAANRCLELGTSVGEADAFGYYSAHLFVIRWIQGRDGELLEVAQEVANSPTLVPNEFSLRATAWLLAAREGHHQQAAEGMAQLTANGLAALPRSSTWIAGISALIETASVLGDAAIAREGYDLLLPFAERPMMPSLAVVCLGSTERALGMAAGAFGDLDAAIGHLDRAVAADRRLGNRPLAALACADAAMVRWRRGGVDDIDQARAMLHTAVAEGEAMGLDARVAEWRELLDQIGAVSREPASGVSTESADPVAPAAPGVDEAVGLRGDSSVGVIRRQGRGWVVEANDRQAYVSDRVGMRYLAELLTNPFDPIPALVLAGAASVHEAGASRQTMHDSKARRSYLARIRELSEELSDAEAASDLGRADMLRTELEILLDEVGTATGLGGRPRAFADDAERARTAVTKAIKRATDEIADVDPALGDHLRTTISTGTTCVYRPLSNTDLRWSTGSQPLLR